MSMIVAATKVLLLCGLHAITAKACIASLVPEQCNVNDRGRCANAYQGTNNNTSTTILWNKHHNRTNNPPSVYNLYLAPLTLLRLAGSIVPVWVSPNAAFLPAPQYTSNSSCRSHQNQSG